MNTNSIKKPHPPSSKVKKFGLIGTSCAGKSTLAYAVLYHLKKLGVNADGVLQQDRRFSFDRQRLEDDPIAQWSFISNQIKAEADMMLRPGVEVLVCDRSPLDFYAYYEWQYGNNSALAEMVIEWCMMTFEAMYVLAPLPYQDDGARLNEAGRDEAAPVILDLAASMVSRGYTRMFYVGYDHYPKAQKVERDKVVQHIVRHVGHVLSADDLNMVPSILGVGQCLVGGSYAFNRATKSSDLDVYVLTDKPLETGHKSLEAYVTRLQDVLGVRVEVRGVVPEVYTYLREVQKFKEIKKNEPHTKAT